MPRRSSPKSLSSVTGILSSLGYVYRVSVVYCVNSLRLMPLISGGLHVTLVHVPFRVRCLFAEHISLTNSFLMTKNRNGPRRIGHSCSKNLIICDILHNPLTKERCEAMPNPNR